MNDTARTMLVRLVSLYGVSIAHDANRCEGLLRDTCPECNREIFVLVHAVRQHIPDDLLTPRHTLPLALTEAFLVKRLEDELGFSVDVARWAVTSWAEALGRADPAPAPVQELVRVAPEPVSGSTDTALRAQWTEKLRNATRTVRLGIIANLAAAPDATNSRLLIATLENDDRAVREAAFDALCDPGTSASGLLIDALHEAPEGLTWRIVLVLGALKARDAVGSLLPLLDRSPRVRDAAIWALGEIGDTRAATALMDLIRHADSATGHAAEDALRKIGR
jgi:HEAT repeat protein